MVWLTIGRSCDNGVELMFSITLRFCCNYEDNDQIVYLIHYFQVLRDDVNFLASLRNGLLGLTVQLASEEISQAARHLS